MLQSFALITEGTTPKIAKPFKGQAGYHLQQASEKLIKIQIYSSGKPLNYSKLYKHNLDDLILYAQGLGITLSVPLYVRQHRKHLSPILLREIIEAMLFIESVIRPHAPLHLPDQIAEDLQTAHTIKEFFGGLYLRVII